LTVNRSSSWKKSAEAY